MSSHPAAPLLAADLGNLPHTNNRGEKGLVHVPGFRTSGMAENQAAENGLLAQAIAEGIIEDLAKHGYLVVTKAEIQAKVKAAETAQASNELVLHCNRCRQIVLKVDTSSPAPKLHVKIAALALTAHAEACR